MGASASRASRKKGQGPVAKPKSQSAPANRAILQASGGSSAYPLTGLHVDHLRALVRDHPELTKKDIGTLVRKLILPTTKDKSYVEHLRLSADTARLTSDKADAFVSYAWSMSLATVVDSLRGFSGFIWMDCFVLNQHFKHVITPDVLQGVFGDALEAIGKVFIVASPWRKPVVVERIWCVYEQYTAFEKKAAVTLVLPTEEDKDLKRALESGMGHANFLEMFAGINVTRAQARELADRDAILALMRGKETEVNNVTMLGIKEWLVKTAGGLGFDEGSKEQVWAMNAIGAMLNAMGSLDEALPYYEKAVKLAGPAFGAESSEFATFLNNLAELYRAQGKYNEAAPLHDEALAIRKRALGNDHPDVAQSLNNLAALYHAQGSYDAAIPLFKEAMEIDKRALGNDHPAVATALNNLAGLLSAQGDYAGAAEKTKEALDINVRALGSDHPSTITSRAWLGTLLYQQGKLDDALPVFLEVVASRQRVLGESHPQTAEALNNLAGLYKAQGKEAEANRMGKEALRIAERALGSEHPKTKQLRKTWGN